MSSDRGQRNPFLRGRGRGNSVFAISRAKSESENVPQSSVGLMIGCGAARGRVISIVHTLVFYSMLSYVENYDPIIGPTSVM